MSRRQHIGNYMQDDEEQAYSPPPTPRDPVHVTAAYLVAYLGTFPKEKKDHLMQVAEAFASYLGLPQHEETATDMCARVQHRVEEMARVLHMIAELRAIADNNKPLTVGASSFVIEIPA